MSIYKRGQIWYADFSVAGQRYREPLGVTDRKEALRLHDELKVAVRTRKVSGHTWYDAVKSWVAVTERNESDKYRLRAMDCGDIPLASITSSSFPLESKSAGNYQRYVNLLKAVLNHAKELGWIDKVPPFPRRVTPKGRIRWITLDEWRRLYAELPEHLKPPALFAVSTGLRQDNVLGLEWSRVDIDRRLVWVEAPDMKSKHAHGIPLSDDALVALTMAQGQSDRWCFPYKGNRMEQVKGAWKKALARAEIDDFTWHDLRHTWASWHIMRGTPLEVLQKLGGWADLKMVLRYAHLAPSHLAQFANNYGTISVTNSQAGG